MIGLLLRKLFGTKHERDVKNFMPIVSAITALEPEICELSDEALRAKTLEFKNRLNEGETLDDILIETFAVVRETAKRTIQMRHFDVQLMGGIVLHDGKIAEMKTGEGKTLVATLPAYLNALTGKGVHIITVNDYLAKRDREWMGPIYESLGLTIGLIQHDTPPHIRREAYRSDIVYGTNNEFGFDYLRDNMVPRKEMKVQREHYYGIVDEVDSILIDEARTPLIISGPAEESTDKYYKINKIIPYLKKDQDYQVDEKIHSATLTEDGVRRVEKLLNIKNLFAPANMDIVHHTNQALKAHTLFRRDVEYMIKDGEILIIDEFTGRIMPGRRYSEGLHQALEAKEGVRIKEENQTLATITFQNYFRMYQKLAGMTGTADTEAEEFDKIYHLEVVVIPTNAPMIRTDFPDVIYKTEREKFKGVIEEIVKLYRLGRPVLVGTISVEKSERLSDMLRAKGIAHQVLNAKYHEKEAQIIALAGHHATVTIATNMAGRGTDIVLSEGIAKLGGLHILGTERHEARRIDNQLRGRAGRQGDMGSSRFYLSLEDDLMRIFGSAKIATLMDKLGIQEGEVIEHPWITKAIERAQRQVEGHNFDIRKRLLEFDDVMNQQRTVIYNERNTILEEENLVEHFYEMLEEVKERIISTCVDKESSPEQWDISGLTSAILQTFGIHIQDQYNDYTALNDVITNQVTEAFKAKESHIPVINELIREIMIHCVDSLWKDHLYSMDYLKEGIGLRAYGQKDPLIEYKKEGYDMFSSLIARIKETIVEYLFKVQVTPIQQPQVIHHRKVPELELSVRHIDVTGKKHRHEEKGKIGRNDLCPCGSKKKYKYCHGR